MRCPFCKEEVDFVDERCPRCATALGAASPERLELTRPQRIISPPAQAASIADETVLQRRKPDPDAARTKFRPRLRPPMLVLCAWDDDGEYGHWIRVYGDRFVIGRGEGDLIIPHDPGMSQRHAELVRERGEGRWVWRLRDLQSTNGSFVRIDHSTLHDGQVLLIGSGRYQFKGVAQGGKLAQATGQPAKTMMVPTYRPEDFTPMLVRLAIDGEEDEKMFLTPGEQWIGTADSCQLRGRGGAEDLLLDARHARIYQTGREQWEIQDAGSNNGTWTMISEVVIDDSIQFQLGEQRFVARVP